MSWERCTQETDSFCEISGKSKQNKGDNCNFQISRHHMQQLANIQQSQLAKVKAWMCCSMNLLSRNAVCFQELFDNQLGLIKTVRNTDWCETQLEKLRNPFVILSIQCNWKKQLLSNNAIILIEWGWNWSASFGVPPSRAEMVSGRQCHFHHRVLRRCACLESHASWRQKCKGDLRSR